MTVIKGTHDEECLSCARVLDCPGKPPKVKNCLRYLKYGDSETTGSRSQDDSRHH